jgi:hypothetical protein
LSGQVAVAVEIVTRVEVSLVLALAQGLVDTGMMLRQVLRGVLVVAVALVVSVLYTLVVAEDKVLL